MPLEVYHAITIEKDPKTQVRIAVLEYRGSRYVDIRLFFLAPDGTFRPSKTGITLSLHSIPDLHEAALKLDEWRQTQEAFAEPTASHDEPAEPQR